MLSSMLSSLVDELRQVVGIDGVLSAHSDLVVYECDGFVIEKNCPDVVVFPRTTQHVAAIVQAVQQAWRAVCAARGGHQPGRRLPAGRRRRDDRAHADEADRGDQPPRSLRRRAAGRGECRGSTNALKGTGYHYAPDPSSQGACTIGGNVATNSGGPHTLKYGVTVNHVLGVEAVLADGAIVAVRRPGRRLRWGSIWPARWSAAKARWRSSPRFGSG